MSPGASPTAVCGPSSHNRAWFLMTRGWRVARRLTGIGLPVRPPPAAVAMCGSTGDFSETFLVPVDGAIIVPTGEGPEAFVDAEDSAAVVAARLAGPEGHAGAEWASTGPEALTVSEAACTISHVTARPVRVDVGRHSLGRGSDRFAGPRQVRRGAPTAHGDQRLGSRWPAQQQHRKSDRNAAYEFRRLAQRTVAARDEGVAQ